MSRRGRRRERWPASAPLSEVYGRRGPGCRTEPGRPASRLYHTATIRAMLDPKVFKAYDVRGIYPSELDEEGAYAIGRAYVEQFEPHRVAVGRDMRLSSPAMARAAIRGAADAGAEVLDLGLV